jgi:isopropylmalate/homocitrate/citramalate synthase
MSFTKTHTLPPPDIILDTTLRDGEQSPGVVLMPEEKAEYVRRAEEIGIRYIEIGFPHNAYDREACYAAAMAAKHARLVAMALTTTESVKWVIEAGAHEILFVVPCSTSHLKYVYGKSLDRLLSDMLEAIEFADCHGLAVNVGLEDASEGDLPVIGQVLKQLGRLAHKIDCITIPDTRGQLLPAEVVELIGSLRQQMASVSCRLAFHGHNDLGLATANALASLQMKEPVDCVHVTTCGYGERAGNASLEQLLVLLELKLGRQTNINLKRLSYLTEYVQQIFLTPIHPHAPVIGSKVFLHESALHQKGMLNNASSYQYLDAAQFGRQVEMLLGKHSGTPLRQQIAEKVDCSEAEVCALQREVATTNKEEAKAIIQQAVEAIRRHSLIGIETSEAISRLRKVRERTDP